jgi:hypothetical protein
LYETKGQQNFSKDQDTMASTTPATIKASSTALVLIEFQVWLLCMV